jgi:membrane fusion protein (multidrug efflux system)
MLVTGTTIGVLVSALLVVMGRSTPQEVAQAVAPPEVEVVPVAQRDVPVYGEWIGTLEGMVNATIKAQVTGYLRQQRYTEGALVTPGQVLFAIDQLVQANAQLAQAEANQGKTQLDVDRYIPLAKAQAISAQDLDNAVQNNLAAKAQVAAAKAGIDVAQAAIVEAKAVVEAAKAQVATATLTLGFTTIVSPITGIAGIATAQVGDLVGPNSGTLTTVSTLDPIKVYYTASEQEYLTSVRQHPTATARAAVQTQAALELLLADGTTYPQQGTFFVADREVNVQTGAIRLAGLFPNPGNVLRPGQYGRVRAVTSQREGALLVPQRAVTELQGRYQVAVVDSENTINFRTVKVGERVGPLWIIEEGVHPGERVVVEGLQKVRPGMPVYPRPLGAAPSTTGDN